MIDDPERYAILTNVPAEVRKDVHEKELQAAKRTLILKTVIYGIAIVCMLIYGYLLVPEDMDFTRGYAEGFAVIVIIDAVFDYKYAGRIWRAPTQEEYNELGDMIA